MTYFEGFVAPVPEANKEAYRKHAADAAPIFQEFGVKRHVEAWDSDVPKARSPISARRSTPSRTRKWSSPGSNIPTRRRATPSTRR